MKSWGEQLILKQKQKLLLSNTYEHFSNFSSYTLIQHTKNTISNYYPVSNVLL